VIPIEGTCDFCTEAVSGEVDSKFAAAIGRRSRTLLQFTSLYVVPTISPIVANHILLIPRRHVTSRPQLAAAERDDVTSAESDLRRLLAAPGCSIVSFEHGIGEGSHGGCGVSHFHVHIMPLEHDIAAKALTLLRHSPLGSFTEDLIELHPRDSYVYMRSDGDGASAAMIRKGEFPSQYLRNLVEDAAGIDRTNWRDIVRSELLEETLVAPHWMVAPHWT
jgi:diadenosine tetraphosphate (Ap4A) HIT family hydrolase